MNRLETLRSPPLRERSQRSRVSCSRLRHNDWERQRRKLQTGKLDISSWQHGNLRFWTAHELHGRSFKSSELLHCLVQSLLGPTELNHAGLQIVQCALDQTVLLLVVRQEEMPQGMLYHNDLSNAGFQFKTIWQTDLAQDFGIS
jgi:hypothetical protein